MNDLNPERRTVITNKVGQNLEFKDRWTNDKRVLRNGDDNEPWRGFTEFTLKTRTRNTKTKGRDLGQYFKTTTPNKQQEPMTVDTPEMSSSSTSPESRVEQNLRAQMLKAYQSSTSIDVASDNNGDY